MKDPLDELLQKSPLREAPPWFEVKTMARLRREQEEKVPWFAFLRERWVLSGAFALVVAVISILYFNSYPTETLEQHEKIMAALDAFENYDEDQSLWESDLL